MSRTIYVHKAASLLEQPEVETLRIEAVNPFPEGLSSEVRQELQQRQAVAVVDGIVATLPGGVVDRILAELLRRRASELIVPALHYGGAR